MSDAPSDIPSDPPTGSVSESADATLGKGRAKRFRGGDLPEETAGPTWFRLLFPIAALAVAVILITALVLWLVTGIDSRPDLIVAAIERYDSRAIPISAFAEREAGVIRSSPGLVLRNSPNAELKTPQQFDLFLLQSLQRAQNETLVVYLTMQGVSDEHGSYLLLAGSNPDPANGYPIGRLLGHLANSSAKNILLVLNVTHLAADLDLGILGNDFAVDLKNEFEQLRLRLNRHGQDDAKNLWVLCSAADGQQSHSSVSLGWNAFGLTCAYGLYGGRLVEERSEVEQVDGWVSVEEFCRFVSTRVSQWASKTMKQDQTPVLFRMGDSFPLVEISNSVYADELVQATGKAPSDSPSTSDAAKDEQTKSAETKQDAEAKPDQAAAAPAQPGPDATAKIREAKQSYWQTRFQVERARQITRDPRGLLYRAPPSGLPSIGSATPASPTDAQLSQEANLLQTLWEVWAIHHGMNEADYFGDSLNWHYFQQLILYAEQLYLARRFDDARKIVDEELPAALEAVQRDKSKSRWLSWSLATPGDLTPQQAADRSQKIQAALAEPTDENIAALQTIACAEGDLLITLATRIRDNGTWLFPELVRTAVETRTLAEGVAQLKHESLRARFADRVRQADALRRQGEVELLLSRPNRSQVLLEHAAVEYRSVLTELTMYRRALADINLTTADVPFILRWLGIVGATSSSADVQYIRERFASFLVGREQDANRFEPASIQQLARLAREIRQACIDHTENAWQKGSELGIRAGLKLPFLPTELRQRLMAQLLNQTPTSPLALEAFPVVASEARRLANPYPLQPVILFATGSEGAANPFKQLSPLLTEPAHWQELESNPQLRQARSRLGETVRELIYRLEVDPAQVQAMASPILPARARMLSAFVAARHSQPIADYPYHILVERTQRIDELNWQLRRAVDDARALQMQASALPTSTRLTLLSTAAVSLSPNLWPIAITNAFQLKSGTELTLSDEIKEIELRLRSNMDMGEMSGTLILDWLADAELAAISSPMASAENGRLAVPLAAMRSGDTLTIPLTVEPVAAVPEPRPMAITARVEIGDGTVQWIPLNWKLTPVAPQPAELTISWPEAGGQIRSVDLFPNQSLEVAIGIIKNIKPAMNLRVEIFGQGTLLARLPIAAAADVTGRLPVPVAADTTWSTRRGPFTLRLYDGDTLLQEKQLPIEVLDPLKYFDCQASFDADTGKVTAAVRQTGGSDSLQPVPLNLDVGGLTLDQGILQAVLAGPGASAVLQAQLPVDFTARQFEARVGVAGVPRLFRFLVGLDYPSGLPIDRLDLQLKSPEPGTVFLPSDQPLSPVISFQADGPGELSLNLGIDRNENGELDPADARSSQTYWMGKDVTINLSGGPKKETFTVTAVVQDLQLPLPANQLLGAQQILAELQDSFTARQQFPLYFVDTVPPISISEPLAATPIAQGDPLAVTIKGDPKLYAAVAKLEFGFDKNGNARFDDDEAVLPLDVDPAQPFTFANSHLVSLSLPTTELAVGPATLMVRATTNAHDITDPTKVTTLTGKLQRRLIEIRPASESPTLVALGTVTGQVVVNNSGVARVRVSLAGTNLVAISDETGRFRIADVPSGAYNLLAESYNRIGQQVVTVEPGKETTTTVYLSLR